MQARYQNGCLTTVTRKDGIERWQFRWRARNPDGSLRPCKKTIGPVSEYPLKSKKLQEALPRLRARLLPRFSDSRAMNPLRLRSGLVSVARRLLSIPWWGPCSH